MIKIDEINKILTNENGETEKTLVNDVKADKVEGVENVREHNERNENGEISQRNRVCYSLRNLCIHVLHRLKSYIQSFLPRKDQSRSSNSTPERELEGDVADSRSPVLPSSEEIHRRDAVSSTGIRKTTQNNSYCRQSIEESRETGLMPNTVIPPNKHLSVGDNVPRKRGVGFSVKSNLPEDTFVLDTKGLDDYRMNGRSWMSYGGFTDRKIHRQSLYLPFDGMWYLLIVNWHPTPLDVYYEVYP